MRNMAFVLAGMILLIFQANLFRAVALMHQAMDSLGRWMAGNAMAPVVPTLHELGDLIAVPNLLLPLLVFTGVHEYSLARGALLAFVLGYALDIFHGSPIGMFTFISVVTFVLARAAGVRLAAQTMLTQLALAFVFALAQGLLVFVLLAIFGRNPTGSRALTGIILPYAVSTALAAPIVFRAAQAIHSLTTTIPRPGEGPLR